MGLYIYLFPNTTRLSGISSTLPLRSAGAIPAIFLKIRKRFLKNIYRYVVETRGFAIRWKLCREPLYVGFRKLLILVVLTRITFVKPDAVTQVIKKQLWRVCWSRCGAVGYVSISNKCWFIRHSCGYWIKRFSRASRFIENTLITVL
jgi:hypothetical protein